MALDAESSERIRVAAQPPVTSMMPEMQIQPSNSIDAVAEAPSSKSMTNRVLFIAGLADGISYIEKCLLSEDTVIMIKALQELGIPMTLEGNNITVMGRAGRIGLVRSRIHCGNAGTVFRFLTSGLALGHGRYVLDGDDRMRQRPVKDLIEALRGAGVEVACEMQEGYPPLLIMADGFAGGKVRVAGETSSQYLSGLLMCAPYARTNVRIEVTGHLVSRPYIDMTLAVMKAFGVNVTFRDDHTYEIDAPQKYRPKHYTVEGDASSASYFFAAAAVTGGRVRVSNLDYGTTQGDVRFVDILSQMGCRLTHGEGWIELTGGPLHAVDADLNEMPDMVPTLAVVSLFAPGKTVIRNIAHLRIKESDRIGDLARELRKLGARVEEGADFLAVSGEILNGAVLDTHKDHRLAMSFAVAGLKIPGIVVQDPDCVQKSFPNFWEAFRRLYD